MTNTPYTFFIVSHTHWDREWYKSFEHFRQMLVDVVDHAMDTLERDERFTVFHLDGQTAAALDYLEIRPHQRRRFMRLARAGRLVLGPFYILNDTNLTSGESTVRNLLMGHMDCEELGARPMHCGYILDQFGHASQMPQILRGFGMRTALTGRGITPGQLGGVNTFTWRGADGSRVLAHFLAQWYNNFQRMPENDALAGRAIARNIEKIGPLSPGRSILLMNGVDHLDVQGDLHDKLENYKARHDMPHEFRHANVEEFFAALERDVVAADQSPPVWKGELREGDDWNMLTGTLSSRVYLKQENYLRSRRLERVAEPMCAMAGVLADPDFYPADALRYAWRTLMKNHPHDSICGCSIDEVHRQMMARFAKVRDVETFWVRRAAEAIGHRVAFDAAANPSAEQILVAWNPAGYARDAIVDFEINLPAPETSGDWPLPEIFPLGQPGERLHLDVLSFERAMWHVLHPMKLPFFIPVQRYRIRARFTDLPPVGYRAYAVRRGAAMQAPLIQTIQSRQDERAILENEFLHVAVNFNGSLDILHKPTGRMWASLGAFEDAGDAGTEYMFMPPRNQQVISSVEAPAQVQVIRQDSLTQCARISIPLDLPQGIDFAGERRDPQTIPHAIDMQIVLKPGSPALEVTVRFENLAENHRLRAIFPIDGECEDDFDVIAGMPFDATHRQPRAVWETPIHGEPHQDFVAVRDDDGGLALLTDGLAEYEFDWDLETLELTLLRATGALSHEMKPEYRGRLREFATPEAQCIGDHTFRFAIMPFGPETMAADIRREAEIFLLPPEIEATPVNPADWFTGQMNPAEMNSCWEVPFEKLFPWKRSLPAEASLVRCDNPQIMLSAFKRSEREPGAWICRVFSLADRRESARLTFARPFIEVREANLNERAKKSTLAIAGDSIDIALKPRQILTLWIRFE